VSCLCVVVIVVLECCFNSFAEVVRAVKCMLKRRGNIAGGEFLFLSSFVEYVFVVVHTSSVALLGVLQTLFLTRTIVHEEDCVFFWWSVCLKPSRYSMSR